jgi:hypothetical protein
MRAFFNDDYYLQNKKSIEPPAEASLPKRQRSYLSDDDDKLSFSDSEIVPASLTNVFRETSDECSYSDSDELKDKTTESSTSTKEVENKRPTTKKRQYITQDIASDALKAYQMQVTSLFMIIWTC